MTLAELAMLAGLPCTLSLITLTNERLKNAHYVCIGAWGGVFLRYMDMGALFIFTLGAMIMFSGHLIMIIRNEKLVEKIIKRFLHRTSIS